MVGSSFTRVGSGRVSTAHAPITPVTHVSAIAADRAPRIASTPTPIPMPRSTTSAPTTSTTLSLVPKVSIAHSFSGLGTQSMNTCPTGTTGEDVRSKRPTISSAVARPAPVATRPSRGPVHLGPYDRSSMDTDVSDSATSRARTIVSEVGVSENVRLSEELVSEALGLIGDQPDTLDLKIATAALAEMRDAYAMFAPYKRRRKVSIFGSARTREDDPLYGLARDIAATLAERGWMTVTGAGPGIMQAGMEGAGREKSIGVSIRLPFETGANSIIAGDDKHVSMKYFFTRKLMLIKESAGFVCLPGGFGTLDEMFELLTLTQTGKGVPVPIVLLDEPGDPYWEGVDTFVREQLIARGLVSANDVDLYTITSSCDEATAIIDGFYANYHSIRYVGDVLVMRLRQGPTDEQLAELNDRFAHLVKSGRIERTEPFKVERRDDDRVDLDRISFTFAKRGYSDLVAMIRMINGFVGDRPAPVQSLGPAPSS